MDGTGRGTKDATCIRHRRLPAEQMVWLMVALAPYRHKSIGEVLDDLGLALPDSQTPFVSTSAAAPRFQSFKVAVRSLRTPLVRTGLPGLCF